jgi:hypothetical protein
VTNSSAQDSYSIILGNTDNMASSSGVVSITNEPYDYLISEDTITLDLGDYNPAQTITLNSGADTVLCTGDTIFTSSWITNIPFENSFPEWEDFQGMCKEYPGMAQAYEKLKTFYDLCKDEWEHKKKEQK